MLLGSNPEKSLGTWRFRLAWNFVKIHVQWSCFPETCSKRPHNVHKANNLFMIHLWKVRNRRTPRKSWNVWDSSDDEFIWIYAMQSIYIHIYIYIAIYIYMYRYIYIYGLQACEHIIRLIIGECVEERNMDEAGWWLWSQYVPHFFVGLSHWPSFGNGL